MVKSHSKTRQRFCSKDNPSENWTVQFSDGHCLIQEFLMFNAGVLFQWSLSEHNLYPEIEKYVSIIQKPNRKSNGKASLSHFLQKKIFL
jgi:hypothetical protein